MSKDYINMLKSWVILSMKYVNLTILRLLFKRASCFVHTVSYYGKNYVIMFKRRVILVNQYVVLFNWMVLFPKIYAYNIVWTKRHVGLT